MMATKFIKKYTAKGVLLLPLLLGFAACAKAMPSLERNPDEGAKKVRITIDLEKTYQRIDNFGASDAWSTQFVGQWPDAKRNAMADLLFSQALDANGKPKGIGLSLWRFNIGAGSFDGKTIRDEWRSAESFLQADGNYDWQKQAGQVWFLKAAKARGVDQFLAFPNSPPVQMTVNGKAFATAGVSNLLPSRFDEYADYLTRVLKGLSTQVGINFQYISPVNEPQWDWSDGNQEGTPFTNAEISGLVKSLNRSLERENVNTEIMVSEAGQYEFMYADYGKPGYGKQVDAFFNPRSENYIGDLSKLAPVMAAHSYFTSSPLTKAVAIRQQVASKVAEVKNLRFWQSEYCILGDNDGEIEGNKQDLGINSALYVARTIHNDLVEANATAWQWWLAISPYDYKDGLIYIDRNKTDGTYQPSKILWALGNFSRFVRPGAVRVAVNTADARNQEKLFISSYKHDGQLITVIVNESHQAIPVDLAVVNGKIAAQSESYLTSADADLTPGIKADVTDGMTVEARSITTVISKIL